MRRMAFTSDIGVHRFAWNAPLPPAPTWTIDQWTMQRFSGFLRRRLTASDIGLPACLGPAITRNGGALISSQLNSPHFIVDLAAAKLSAKHRESTRRCFPAVRLVRRLTRGACKLCVMDELGLLAWLTLIEFDKHFRKILIQGHLDRVGLRWPVRAPDLGPTRPCIVRHCLCSDRPQEHNI